MQRTSGSWHMCVSVWVCVWHKYKSAEYVRASSKFKELMMMCI